MTVLLALALLVADPPAKADLKPAGPPQFEMQFVNGSTLKQVTVLTNMLQVATKYGKLSIPTTDLRQVEFGKGAKAVDTIEAAEFTARGKLETTELKVRTAEFGESTVKVATLRGLRFTPAGSRSASLTVDGAKYARPGWVEWMDSGVDAISGDLLEITASGTLDLMAQSPGSQTTGPAGANMPAPPMPNGVRPPNEGNGRSRPWWMSGQLIARIGKDGKPFPIGASHKQPAAASGRVYLIIAPTGFGTECTGGYKVDIRVGG